MPKRKLTAKVKQEIKEGRGRVRLKDYSGEAQDYARYYNHMMKGTRKRKREEKKANQFFELLLQEDEKTKSKRQKQSERLILNGEEINHSTEIYEIASRLAEQRGVSVSKLNPSEKKAVEKLAANGRLSFAKELMYVLAEMKKAADIYLKKTKIAYLTVHMKLVRMKEVMYANAKIYHYLIMPYYLNLKGDMYISFPESFEWKPFLKMKDEREKINGLRSLLRKYKIKYTPNE